MSGYAGTKRHVRMAISDTALSLIQSEADRLDMTDGIIASELIEETMRRRGRANRTSGMRTTSPRADEIAAAAGIEGIGADEMRERLLDLGLFCWREDLREGLR